MKYLGNGTSKIYETLANRWIGDFEELLDLDFFPHFVVENIKNEKQGLWRYFSSLPLANEEEKVSLGEMITPISTLKLPNQREILVKQDQLFPTGSYKDRGAAVLISFLKELGVREVIQDSSGNAGASIAAYAASANIACTIYLPQETSPSKILQMQAYGANIVKVKGSRQDTANAAKEAAKGLSYASHCYNPVFFQGTKTFAFEMAEQMHWDVPDALVLPAGNGTLLLGAYIGFKELLHSGAIQKMPQLFGVQTAACDPLTRAFNHLAPLAEGKATLAEGIAILNPIRAKQMIEAIENTQGSFVSVDEMQITETWKYLVQNGYYVEPTSAATIAGAAVIAQTLPLSWKIASVFTGHGLKSSDKIEKILHK